jgi:hypothetical protein
MPLTTLTAEQMAEWLGGGLAERRNLEFKPPFDWSAEKDVWVREKVIRAMLAMTNTPTGGVIIVGIDAQSGSPILKGLTANQLASFGNFEAIKSTVDGFASMATDFTISRGAWESKELLVVAVTEFSRRPVLCRKNGQSIDVLRERDLYVRPQKGEPRSDRMSELELEEIVGLAMSKEAAIRRAQGWTPPDLEAASRAYRAMLGDLG